MKYSLDCCIRTNNAGFRNAVSQLIPDVSDDAVYSDGYRFGEGEEDGIQAFACQVRFNTETDCMGKYNAIKGLTGIINACESGSFVRVIKTWHDENTDNPPRACEVFLEVRKN